MRAFLVSLIALVSAGVVVLAAVAALPASHPTRTRVRAPAANTPAAKDPAHGPPSQGHPPQDANDTLLASVQFSAGFRTWFPVDSVENLFVMSNDSGSVPTWDIGDGVAHTDTTPTNFTAASDPDFPTVAALLTNGVDDWIDLDTSPPGSGGVGAGTWEHGWLRLNPDLVNHTVDAIRLVIYDLTFTPLGNGTFVSENYTWEIWGHANVADVKISSTTATASLFIAPVGRFAMDDLLVA